MHIPRVPRGRRARRALIAIVAAAVASSSGLAACGGAAPPTRARTETVAALRTAEEVGAARSPDASYHLALATQQAEDAEAMIQEGRMEDAELTLERAKADADLAIALAHEAETRAEAQRARDHVRALRESTR